MRDLPDFTDPPLNEVVLSIQFASLTGLKSAHIGLFWERIRSEYPNVSEQAPIQAVFETFGIPTAQAQPFQIATFMSPPLPRYWFERSNAPDLLQIQHDRILHNWRQQIDSSRVYPRYEAVKASLEKDLEVFQKWLADESIGEIKPNQCEVTYINIIPTGDDRYEHLEKITPLWAGAFSGSHPNSLERALVQTTFLFSIDDAPAGRVYVNFQPAFLPNDLTPVVRLEVTARGRPRGESVADAFSFLDIERDQVVRTFAAVTTQEMHKLWGRTDAKR
ncbi:MAG: TIGR04255 family protein [Xanthobacteraceae bacterium]